LRLLGEVLISFLQRKKMLHPRMFVSHQFPSGLAHLLGEKAGFCSSISRIYPRVFSRILVLVLTFFISGGFPPSRTR
jgi:hypothetical protein